MVTCVSKLMFKCCFFFMNTRLDFLLICISCLQRITESISEYVARTPTFSDDGAVTLGSKRSTLFEVDAKTGSIIQVHAMSGFDNASAPWSDDRQGVTNILSAKKKDLADPVKQNSRPLLLKIFRTDYSLQSVGPNPGRVLWTTKVAEFEAVLLCQHTSFDVEDEYDSHSGLNFSMPYPCQEIQQVFRLKKNFLLEPSVAGRLPKAYHENDMLSMPTSDPILPLQLDRFFNGHDGDLMLPAAMPHSLPSRQPEISFHDSDDNADVLLHPLMEINIPWAVYLSRMSFLLPLVIVFLGFICCSRLNKNQDILKDQNSESELKSSPAKKKRTRKSGKNNGTVDKKDKRLSSEDEDLVTQKATGGEVWQNSNQVDGRKIGKLLVSNKEIAKGSNGTIVLEGIYEGRAVAVKRLVKAHHDVASKEIQNLIVSDHHPNIVRWHGVEYDRDFVYLSLERCTCNLGDLIEIYSDISEIPMFRKDQAFRCLIRAQMETGKDNTQNLWKSNGYPSPLLLKLMRLILCLLDLMIY